MCVRNTYFLYIFFSVFVILVSLLKKNDLLLIAGKGHETFQAVGIETLPFDDYTVAKEAIKNFEKSGIIN